MTITEAREIVESKDYKNPQYSEARKFIHFWKMDNDEGYAAGAKRIEARMRQEFISAGIISL